ncbi:nucleotidyl transferase AbiEii/AbiGii toxin family protein [Saccharothrix yanglingensis]|uniref:Nucleotidyltransferase n=1 Tax=Saccharothrix yanglingensis TaxID=659496 RepID=A0ABU0WTG3_9PSEU|nr:nucleotidyl transferase AbiEii/AbiGii toxin family protein [Saccharothrix yanglingensis]MDQ2582419.1 hypothetical protein [Saccharothrix yanglingensis]
MAREAGVDYLVVGATARSLVSFDLLGRSPARQTRDVDIAAEVGSWGEFDNLVRKSDRHGNSAHKCIVEGVEVDVVPYGDIGQEGRRIVWSDDHAMNVLGFREAVHTAQTVLLPDGVTIRIPSIPALALLKLLAWVDRHYDDTRDALDLATMIGWYSSGKYVERLYGEDLHVLEKFDYEPPPAGAWLLGSHIPALLDDDGIAELLRILDDDELMGRLARDMGSPRAALVLQAMSRGIRDVVDEAGRAPST